MYNHLIQEDINKLDSEFFKLDAVYNFTSIYTESEESADKKQSVISKMCTAILNFIRSIRAKILKLFGNDEKANEILKKIDATKTVEVEVYDKEIKALEEESQELQKAVDKAVNGSLTNEDITKIKNKRKTVLGIVGGVLAVGGGTAVAVKKKFKISDLIPFKNKKGASIQNCIKKTEHAIEKLEAELNKEQNKKDIDTDKIEYIKDLLKLEKEHLTDLTKIANEQAQKIDKAISTETKADHSDDDEQTKNLQSKQRPEIVKYPDPVDTTIEDKRKVLSDASKKLKELNSDKSGSSNSEKMASLKHIIDVRDENTITNSEYMDLVNFLRSKDIEEKYSNDGKSTTENETKKNQPGYYPYEHSMSNYKYETGKHTPFRYCTSMIREIKKYCSDNKNFISLTDEESEQIKKTEYHPPALCTDDEAKKIEKIARDINDRCEKAKKENQKNQSSNYRKDFAERLLNHESIDNVPKLKTELKSIINSGKYTDEEYKRMGEIEDRLQFEMILQKVYDDRDKLNTNDQKILDTLTKKTNITADDDKELTILLNKVQDAKYNERKRNKSNEQQTQTNKNDSENDTEQPEKSNNQQSLNNKANENNKNETSNSVNNSNTITTVENGKIVTKLRQEKCSYLSWNVPLKCFEEVSYKTDIIVDPSTNFAYINKIGPEFDIPLDVERAYGIKEKTHIDKTYKIKLAKYVPPPSSTVENIIKGKIYKDKPMKYESSSFNLIGNNSTLRKRGNIIMENTKVLNFIDELEQERRNEVDNNKFKDSISYKYNCLNNAKKDGVEECLSKSFEKFYLDAIPLNDEYKTANHDDLCNDVHDFIKKQGAKSMTYYVGEARKKSPVMKKLYESVEKIVDDKFKEKEEKINETKPELDLVFKMDGETEKKIDVINQDLELDDIAKVISDNVRNTAMSEINRAKEEKENMKQIETDLANDINVKSEAAIERELSLRGINQKSVFQPSLFEGIMIGKMNKLAYTTESTDDVYLYNAMKDYTGAFYEGGDSATPEEIAFVESVRELTLLSMERALKIKKYSLQDIKNLANEYASMK